MKQGTNTYRNLFSRSYENRSILLEWKEVPTDYSGEIAKETFLILDNCQLNNFNRQKRLQNQFDIFHYLVLSHEV